MQTEGLKQPSTKLKLKFAITLHRMKLSRTVLEKINKIG